ncbi:E3 ubiquitin-protein ligase TRIM71-like [Haliotis rubra]|uniref:E3 ubiquitin-protein ligase TRIM71-like n=1 Tax=Haliotis rubra TaxID=36100 RepID=UPI001EE5F598|nr:E3 ubiquitin-protein ligase TRIM71-like [Haliotis rubra]
MRRFNAMTSDSTIQKLLPACHYVARLYMKKAHEAGHRGRNAKLARFRQHYLVRHGDKLANSVKANCQLLCAEVTNLMNERPICARISEDSDITVFTPNSLLLGRATAKNPGGWQPRGSVESKYHLVQTITDEFWKNWTELFAPTRLVVRQKWSTSQRNLQPGDVVLVADKRVLRGDYRLGLIKEVFPGSDSKVRRVTLTYKNPKQGEKQSVYTGVKDTTVSRSVQRLALLVPVDRSSEMEDSNESRYKMCQGHARILLCPIMWHLVHMATSQKLEEHFLTCTICTEVFDNPCTLACYHTFCRKCVVNYTKTKPEAISAKSLLCPFCSKTTEVSSPDRPIDEWADDVKPSFVIQGLLDSFGPGCKDSKNCTCCHREGETTPATVWCSVCDDALCDACARVHSRISSTRHHDTSELTREAIIPRKRNIKCKEHKDENIKFLCKDCKKVTCHTCCVIYHRKCESVVTLESELPALKSQLLNKKETISKKQMEMKTKVDAVKVNVVSEKDRYAEIEQDIKSFGTKAREKITLMENKLLDELKEVSEKHIEQLTADIRSGEISVQMYRQQTELIDQTLHSECDMDVYVMYQGCEAGDMDAVGDVDVKKRMRITRIMFRKNGDRLCRALDDLQLGEIDVQYDGMLNFEGTDVLQDTGNVLDLEAAPVLQDTISIKVAGDDIKDYPADVTVLLVNGTYTVVVTDYYNSSVKSFYYRNKQRRHNKLNMGGEPWGITRLKHNQVAVTVTDTRQIVTVEVNPDLVLLSTITTSKYYWGITSLTPSTLAAGSGRCVDILDMTGNVLRSMNAVDSGKVIIHSPNFLCTTRTGNILVSDSGSKRVLCLTAEGDVVFTFPTTGHTTLRSPCGITSTSTGDILVTDYYQDTVVHLTESGQFVRNILTKDDVVSFPHGVCVDGHDRVYVCNSHSDEIKVFSFSSTV